MKITAWELQSGDKEEIPYLDGLYCTREVWWDHRNLCDVFKIRPDNDIPDLIQWWWQTSSKQNSGLVHIHYSSKKCARNSNCLVGMEESKQKNRLWWKIQDTHKSSLWAGRKVSVLKNPYSAQNTNRNLRFQGLTTGSTVISCLGNPLARYT